MQQLLGVKGFGPKKVEQYGDAVIQICSGHAPQRSVSALFGAKSVTVR